MKNKPLQPKKRSTDRIPPAKELGMESTPKSRAFGQKITDAIIKSLNKKR